MTQHPNPADPPTIALVRDAAGGNEQAFDALFRRHHQRVLRGTALRLGHLLRDCRHAVEDAVQEAFADTFQRIRDGSIRDLESDGSFRHYVTKAAANAALQQRRQERAQKRGGGAVRRRADFALADNETLFGWIQADGAGPSTIAHGAQLEERLEQALLDLPEPYRTALQMRVCTGMSYDEMAASGDVAYPSGEVLTSPKAIRMVVLRAREKLRAAFPEWEVGPS